MPTPATASSIALSSTTPSQRPATYCHRAIGLAASRKICFRWTSAQKNVVDRKMVTMTMTTPVRPTL
jgi:hypothetical protein